jgi:glycosyltransferase involved in cell wall biosynthesis
VKIALVTSFPDDVSRPRGGVEAVSVNLAAALARQPGIEVQVVTVGAACTRPETREVAGVTLHVLPRGNQRLLAFAVGRGRRDVQACLRGIAPDVVHAHDFYGITVRDLDMPRVFTIHGFIHEDTLYAGERFAWLRSRLWKWVETRSWARQPHIVSISPYVRDRLRGIARGKVHDIDNPIDAAFFDVHREPTRPPVVFGASVICERKNTLGLVRAFHRLVRSGLSAQLRLAGHETDRGYANSVREYIRSENLGEHVHLLGGLKAEGVREELAGAAVFALPSFEEGAPMGVAEAMAAGVPVVTSNRCGMPYMVEEAKTGYLIDPEDPAAIAAGLEKVVGDESAGREMGTCAKRVAADRFHPDRVAERTLRVYEEALAERRP